MNRLTNEGGICTDCQGIAYCRSDCLNKQIYDRLKEYEDTGLSPEKIEHMKARLPLRVWLSETPEKMSIFSCCTVARIMELAKADSQGLIITLPCKIGTPVWTIVTGLNGKNPIMFRQNFELSMFPHWGEAVFLTKKEAEEALENIKMKF